MIQRISMALDAMLSECWARNPRFLPDLFFVFAGIGSDF